MEDVIAVIGAGVMGTGVAHNFAQYGFKVIVVDHLESQLERCKDLINRNLRLYGFHPDHLKTKVSREEILENVTFTTNFEAVSSATFIIENVTEDWDIKASVYKKLRSICNENVIYGVNTSAVSITKIANLLPKPENVVGVHFMNPVPIKPMVELIRGYHTSDLSLNRFNHLFELMNKKSITVNDSPGFVTNRAMMIFVNEAIFMVSEGVSTPEDIDVLFKECFGHKMGPLQTADLIGLDTILQSLEMLYDGFNDDKFRPCFLLKKMVNAGLLGMKNGKGFYEYNV